jgi:hypothetical protein
MDPGTGHLELTVRRSIPPPAAKDCSGWAAMSHLFSNSLKSFALITKIDCEGACVIKSLRTDIRKRLEQILETSLPCSETELHQRRKKVADFRVEDIAVSHPVE